MLEAFIQSVRAKLGPGVPPPTPSPKVYYGGPGNDQITGSNGNDTIYGLGGDDILYGGASNDVLWGGTGADRFVYYSPSEGIDIIKDYNYLEGDRIAVSKTGFGATSTNQFSYNNITGTLFFQGTQFVTLENKPADFSTSLGIELV